MVYTYTKLIDNDVRVNDNIEVNNRVIIMKDEILQIKEVKDDGLCLFYSFIDSANLQTNALRLREEVKDHLMKNRESYENISFSYTNNQNEITLNRFMGCFWVGNKFLPFEVVTQRGILNPSLRYNFIK